MRAGLGMHRDDVGAGGGEGLDIWIAGRNHQMHVERLLGMRTERLDHVGADGDVRHKMAVHHIDMDPVAAGGVDGAHFLAEPGKIGREDGRGDDDVA